jgi:hypothetical protein
MKTKLLKNRDDAEVALLKENFIHSKPTRLNLIKVINEDIEALHASMRDETILDSPNWIVIQADRIAQVKRMKKIISLLE